MPRRTRRQLVGGKLEDAEADDRRRRLMNLRRELRLAWNGRSHGKLKLDRLN
ncbi:hypothetical protein [Amycolatopsis sp. cmx-4-68]|uniref:hypothetical protein n=1 Tax=Amycolatopsis sp. cmx-4-68 TaxID=2790938 RepID=UPI00397A0509